MLYSLDAANEGGDHESERLKMYSDDSTILDLTILSVPTLARQAADLNRGISASQVTRVYLPTLVLPTASEALTRCYPAIQARTATRAQAKGNRLLLGACVAATLGAPMLAMAAIMTPATLTALAIMGGAFAMGAEVISEYQSEA